MPTFTYGVTANGVFTGRTQTISGAHLTRLADAVRREFGQVPNGAGGMRDRTDQECIMFLADREIKQLISAARAQEEDVGVNAAKQAVTDISFT